MVQPITGRHLALGVVSECGMRGMPSIRTFCPLYVFSISKVRSVAIPAYHFLFVPYLYFELILENIKKEGGMVQRITGRHVAPCVVSECGKLVRQKPQLSAPYMFLIYGSLGFLPYHPYHFYLSLIYTLN